MIIFQNDRKGTIRFIRELILEIDIRIGMLAHKFQKNK